MRRLRFLPKHGNIQNIYERTYKKSCESPEEKIQQFKTEKNDLPNITGKQVCHKKFDMGNVLQCENGRIKISFPVKEMTFQYLQAFVNGFLTCSDIDETIYQENREIEKTIDFQQKVIKNA